MDLILTWSDNIDYPLFRHFINNYRQHFASINVYLSHKNMELNITNFLMDELSRMGVAVNREPWEIESKARDWRDHAVNSCLQFCHSDWLWFIEPDFFIKDFNKFYETVKKNLDGLDALGFIDANRLHPACLFFRRDKLEKTSRDFSAAPPKWDHYGQFSQEIFTKLRWTELYKIGLVDYVDWYHHGGLTQNYNLVQEGKEPNYNLNNFLVYNAASRTDLVTQCQQYLDLTHKAELLISDIKKFI